MFDHKSAMYSISLICVPIYLSRFMTKKKFLIEVVTFMPSNYECILTFLFRVIHLIFFALF